MNTKDSFTNDGLRDSEEVSFLPKENAKFIGNRPWESLKWMWYTHLGLLMANLLFLVANLASTSRPRSPYEPRIYSPLQEAVLYQQREINSNLFDKNPYKGTPTPELNTAWEGIMDSGVIRVTKDQMIKMNLPLSSAKSAGRDGNTMQMLRSFISYIVFAQNLLRMYTYREYYADHETFTQPEPIIRIHTDHCIDILRQNLMCHGDVALVTYVDNKESKRPEPDFRSKHDCRNFDALQSWVKHHRF